MYAFVTGSAPVLSDERWQSQTNANFWKYKDMLVDDDTYLSVIVNGICPNMEGVYFWTFI